MNPLRPPLLIPGSVPAWYQAPVPPPSGVAMPEIDAQVPQDVPQPIVCTLPPSREPQAPKHAPMPVPEYVEKIRSWFQNGTACRSIAQRLERHDFLTPEGETHWTSRRVMQVLLRNPVVLRRGRRRRPLPDSLVSK
jgi:hypothetical protein